MKKIFVFFVMAFLSSVCFYGTTMAANSEKSGKSANVDVAVQSAVNDVVLMGAVRYNVSGVVTDADTGEPMIGVTVAILEPGSTSIYGTLTDIDGEYFLKASANDILRFSFPGYRTQDIKVDRVPRVLNVRMKSE